MRAKGKNSEVAVLGASGLIESLFQQKPNSERGLLSGAAALFLPRRKEAKARKMDTSTSSLW